MQYLIGDPSEGYLRSPRVTNGFLPITGDRKNIDLGMVSLSLSRQDALIHMQLHLQLPQKKNNEIVSQCFLGPF